MNKSIVDFSLLSIEDEHSSFTMPEELEEAFHSGMYSHQQRIDIFNAIFKKDNVLAREQITDMCRLLEFSGSKDAQEFAHFLLQDMSGSIDIFMKLDLVMTLYNASYVDVNKCLLFVLKHYCDMSSLEKPSIALFIDILRYLLCDELEDNDVKDETYKYIYIFITLDSLPSLFKYKTIVSIQNDSDRPVVKSHLLYMYDTFFIWTVDNDMKILSGQYLLQHSDKLDGISGQILSIAQDEENPPNQRADAADLLLKTNVGVQYSDGARNVISVLAKTTGITNVYNNMQNVHDEDIEESVKDFLLMVAGIDPPQIKVNGTIRPLAFEDVVTEIGPELAAHTGPLRKSIDNSLLRIQLDQLVYPGCQKLSTIFVKIYNRISTHEFKPMLMQRLFEELIDMDNTCSSGHASRLVNVFSGVEDFNINIGYKKQIEGNISGRMFKSIQELEDETTRDAIIGEMSNVGVENRLKWNDFIATHIGAIKDELEREYIGGGYLSENDFAVFFRDAIQFIETGIRT